MTDIAKFRKIIGEIKTLKKLHWKDPKTSVWISKVLRYLKNEFGEDSDYYKQFYRATHGPVAVSSGTPDHVFQQSHLERLERYGGYLKAFLEELQEEDPIQESKFPKELKLHPKIVAVSEKLYRNKHYSQAIFEAVKVLEMEIKTKSRIRDKIGVNLVNHVFNKDHPTIKIVEGDESAQIDEREGFRFLYMGAFLGIKDPKSHSTPNLEDSAKALEYIAFLSLLMKRLDEASV
ncbi:TIGR02391 family protein [Candidatus Nitrosotenuis uzonensis]|uniref:Conserved hypothetical protein CHP02391 domain-containing protein n=1 Tax=Candidatus Nitrosotenuis uzonensis TaxID=1407055 RepID=V6ARX0_9ARCH|nr:TIGR02391 family protein [Candidatus Nitrosotenuis uzonensis]CDI05153.1 hypothetical protein NITUZ_140228 [Candidatus Nitrosotenuis uzonensis]